MDLALTDEQARIRDAARDFAAKVNVGMVGISWGGFNGLQVAALQPPALKAVVTLCSTDDRYADDVHYMGGTMVIDQISWASHMFAINTLPPDPDRGAAC